MAMMPTREDEEELMAEELVVDDTAPQESASPVGSMGVKVMKT